MFCDHTGKTASATTAQARTAAAFTLNAEIKRN
jgi:hypothetical protein